MKRGGRINPVSAKRAALNRERTKALKVVRARSGGRCEAGPVLGKAGLLQARSCLTWATDGHEVQTRGRGGSIVDPTNILDVCRRCHDWITDHPKEALELGLVKSGFTPGDLIIPPGDFVCERPHVPPKVGTDGRY